MDKSAKELIEKMAKYRFNRAVFATEEARDKARRANMPGFVLPALAAAGVGAAGAAGYGAYRGAKALHHKLTGKKHAPEHEKEEEKKEAQLALIEKIAKKGFKPSGIKPENHPMHFPVQLAKGLAGAGAATLVAGGLAKKIHSHLRAKNKDEPMEEDEKKESSMKNIIDDLIKGAQHNTFGRPVSVQTNTSWTHLDTAKTAGMLQALSEQGYSVKEASEYLGLTEAQIQYIVGAVR